MTDNEHYTFGDSAKRAKLPAELSRVRVGIEPSNPTHVRPDDLQQGLEHFGTGDTGGMDE